MELLLLLRCDAHLRDVAPTHPARISAHRPNKWPGRVIRLAQIENTMTTVIARLQTTFETTDEGVGLTVRYMP